MLQLHYNLKVVEPVLQFQTEVSGIELRGWDPTNPVAIPPDLLTAIRSSKAKPLSVAAICFRHCPTLRDLYLAATSRLKGEQTWGRVAGTLAEKFLTELVSDRFNRKLLKRQRNYIALRRVIERRLKQFARARSNDFQRLDRYKVSAADSPSFFETLLCNVGIHELASQEFDFTFRAKGELRARPAETDLLPAEHLGLSRKTTPDFIFPDLKAVGDMKTGYQVEDYHFLTCAGYALAYESQEKMPIDFGMVYFFPTHRNAVSFAQVYIFVIDDELRRRFLLRRNAAYTTILASDAPPFPDETERCSTCKYLRTCQSQGLKVK